MKKLVKIWLEAIPSTIKKDLLRDKRRTRIERRKETVNGQRKYPDYLVMMHQLSILKALSNSKQLMRKGLKNNISKM